MGKLIGRPTSIRAFVVDEENGTIPVRYIDAPEVKTKLRKAQQEDIADYLGGRRPTIYVEVGEEDLRYPYACYDFEEIVREEEEDNFDGPTEPRLFAQATVVFTPKMALF